MKKTAFVERSFKLRFGLKLCFFTLVGALALTIFLYFVVSKSLGGSYGEAIYTIYDLKIRIFPLIFSSFYTISILALVTLSIAVISMLFSHKIAGPIYRLEKNLELIGSGDLTVNTKFRDNDQLTVLEEDMNEMVRSLNHKVRASEDALLELQRCEERLSILLDDKNAGEKDLLEAAEALRKSIEELKKATSCFEVKE